MKTYTPHQLKFDTFEFVSLQDLEINKSIYNHTTLRVTGTINEENKSDYEKQLHKAKPKVVVYYDDDKTKILFKGIITKFDFSYKNQSYYLTLEATSYSKLLDEKEETRIFQNKGTKYKKVFKKIKKDNDNKFSFTCAESSQEQKALVSDDHPVVLQYRETDWEFIQRICSYLNEIVIVDDTKDDSETITILAGLHAASAKDLNNVSGAVRREIDREGNKYPYYKVYGHQHYRSQEIFELGKPVNYQVDNKEEKTEELIVIRNKIYLEEEILKSDLTLVKEDDINVGQRKRKLPPEGVSLRAEVKKLNKKHQAKVDFMDVDSKFKKSKAHWFPIDKPYTNAYFAPEKGDIVEVYFKERNEKHATIRSSTPHNEEETDNPPHLKRIFLDEREIKFDRKNKQIMITGAEDTILINLDKEKVKLENDKQKLEMKGDQMEMSNDNNSVTMNGNKIDVDGKEGVIKMDGSKTKIDFGSKQLKISKMNMNMK